MTELSAEDERLIDAATAVLRSHYDPQRHTTGAALRTRSGAVYTAVSLKAGTDKASVHAEPLAAGQAVLAGDAALDTVVAVQPDSDRGERTHIVTACGVCRELLLAFAPDLYVVVPRPDGPIKRPLRELLPDR